MSAFKVQRRTRVLERTVGVRSLYREQQQTTIADNETRVNFHLKSVLDGLMRLSMT